MLPRSSSSSPGGWFRWSPLLAVIIAAVWAGCGGSGATGSGTTAGHTTGGHGGQGGDGTGGNLSSTGSAQGQLVSVTFEPPSITLTLDGTAPQMASYTMKALYSGG